MTLTVVLLLVVASRLTATTVVAETINDGCKYTIVESTPDQLKFNTSINFQPASTHINLLNLVDNAQKTLRIASFYWYLNADKEFADHPTAQAGKNLMDAIVSAANRGVKVEVVLDGSSKRSMSNPEDIKILHDIGTVKYVNMTHLINFGVMHTKFLIADNESFYLGSSNFDWRSYTQIKEIGISFLECPTLAEDLDKIFETYLLMSDATSVATDFPEHLKTNITSEHPLYLSMANLDANLFFGAAPPAFNGEDHNWTGRTNDIDGLLEVIENARSRIDISVMNYSPRTEFIFPKKFWPRIDDALRRAASERRVKVRLLFSDWSKAEEMMWYRSLNAVQSPTLKGGGIHVKIFKVPSFDEFQKKIPYARVKHDKYMVTERGLYIGTSNWAADYFLDTCGVSLVIESKDNVEAKDGSIIHDMKELFERDFSSDYAHELV